MFEEMDQNKLEQELDAFCHYVRTELAGTINAAIAPHFVCCDKEKGTYTIAYETADWMRNPNGVAHGGIIAAMLDNAMGVVNHIHAPHKATATISMEVSYVLPVPLGKPVRVDVRVSRIGRTVAHSSARLYLEEDPKTDLATAAGAFYMGGNSYIKGYQG